MGMFDTVKVPCPKCGEPHDAQTKSGPCQLKEYTLDNAPDDVMENVNRHAPFECQKCGTYFSYQALVPTDDGVTGAGHASQVNERIADLEAENEQLRNGAQIGPLVGAMTIVKQDERISRLRAVVVAADKARVIQEKRWNDECDHAAAGMTYTAIQERDAEGELDKALAALKPGDLGGDDAR